MGVVDTAKWHWPCSGWTGSPGLAEIATAIHDEGLARHHFHFIQWGQDNVMLLSAVDKQG
jgi:hypothetical protein